MKVLRFVAAAVLLASPALADPPPLPVGVTFVPADESGEVTGQLIGDPEKLLRALIADNWFADPGFNAIAALAAPCVGYLGEEACSRAAIARIKDHSPPVVLVVFRALPDGRTRLTCVGPNPPSSGVEPTVDIDLVRLPVAERTGAARCIIAAAATSGW